MGLCLVSAGVTKVLQVTAFTLVWTHSVEKVDWQEDWRIEGGALRLVEARVKSSGAGMEPPPEARLVDGWWRWAPQVAAPPDLVLGNSGAAGEWRICAGGSCRTLSEIVAHPVGMETTVVRACATAASH
ncbi:MAG: DUF1850 domain-containing protein [Pseudomonadota bacterium]